MSVNTAVIIDDDPIFVFGIKRLLSVLNFSHSTEVYTNGAEALDALKGGVFADVIFLDLNMPVMDGWQFLEEYTQLQVTPKPIIYIVSSSIDPADISKAKEYDNVRDYVVKPVSKSRLQEIMRDIADRKDI